MYEESYDAAAIAIIAGAIGCVFVLMAIGAALRAAFHAVFLLVS